MAAQGNGTEALRRLIGESKTWEANWNRRHDKLKAAVLPAGLPCGADANIVVEHHGTLTDLASFCHMLAMVNTLQLERQLRIEEAEDQTPPLEALLSMSWARAKLNSPIFRAAALALLLLGQMLYTTLSTRTARLKAGEVEVELGEIQQELLKAVRAIPDSAGP